jgi:hypothetical protein
MKIEQDDIEAAALELWAEVFKAQCSLPTEGNSAPRHVLQARAVADCAEEYFRERIAKVLT